MSDENQEKFHKYLQEENAQKAEYLLGVLIAKNLQPIIAQRVRRMTSEPEALNEVKSLTNELLIKRLRTQRAIFHREMVKERTVQKHIDSIDAFTSKTTSLAYYHWLDSKQPEWKVRRSKRELLKKNLLTVFRLPDFALWKDEKENLWCGFAQWQTQKRPAAANDKRQQLRLAPLALLESGYRLTKCLEAEREKLPNQVFALFVACKGVIPFDDLFYALQEIKQIANGPPPRFVDIPIEDFSAPNTTTGVLKEEESRETYLSLWKVLSKRGYRCCNLHLLPSEDLQELLEGLVLSGATSIQGAKEAIAIPMADPYKLGDTQADSIWTRLRLQHSYPVELRHLLSKRGDLTDEEFGALVEGAPYPDLAIGLRLGVEVEKVKEQRQTCERRVFRNA